MRRAEHSRAVAAVLLLAETLKKLLALGPKTLPPRRLFRPTRALGGLGWRRGVKIGSLDQVVVLPEADE